MVTSLLDQEPRGVSLAGKLTNFHACSNGTCTCLSKQMNPVDLILVGVVRRDLIKGPQIDLDQLVSCPDETNWKMSNTLPDIMSGHCQTIFVVGCATRHWNVPPKIELD